MRPHKLFAKSTSIFMLIMRIYGITCAMDIFRKLFKGKYVDCTYAKKASG